MPHRTDSGQKPVILLVEDYEPNVLVATIYLEELGYEHDVARDGVQAVDKARLSDYDAILMDVKMPGLNGYEATQKIRFFEQTQGRPRTPIIGMTAHALVGDKEKCLEAGMDDYVSKPVSIDDLKNKLEAVIRH